MDNFLLSLPKEGLYYFDKIDKNKINVAFTYKKNNLIKRLIRKIDLLLIKFHLSFFNRFVCKACYDRKIYEAVIKDSGLAILDYGVEEDLLLLAKKRKCKNFFLLIWNTLNDESVKRYSKYLDKSHIFSYSFEDCQKYSLQHFNDFYLIDYPVKSSKESIDMFYLGSDKNRIDFLQNFSLLIKDTFVFEFDVFTHDKTKRNGKNGITYINEYIKFDDYLRKVISSKCLIDFNNHNNITFRTIESMIFRKKYITNNALIGKMDFYNPNNILIINEKTSINDVKEFMSKKYVPIPRNILLNYDIYTVYDFFKAKVRIE